MSALDGRRIWFVGIGGAGLSGYALLARTWGAEVGGWDRVETPYLASLGDVLVELAPDPVVPEGWPEVVDLSHAVHWVRAIGGRFVVSIPTHFHEAMEAGSDEVL